MTPKQHTQCHIAIHSASAAAAGVGAGLAQLPGSDAPVIMTIQIGMGFALGKIFNIQLSEAMVRASIFTAMAVVSGPIIARTATQFLFGWIPGVGNAVNATTAAGITEAIGWILADEHDKQSRDPGDTTPGDTTPGDTTPGDTTPGNTTPGATTP